MDQADGAIDETGEVMMPINHDTSELSLPAIEIIDDRTGEDDDMSSEDGPRTPATTMSEGKQTVTARTYQLEMLDESLKKNIIIAVSLCLPV